MTSFHCKKCGTSVNGVGPEQRWTCPKCKNVALREQLEKLADQDSVNEKELIKSNKMLQKMFRKFKRVPEEDSGDDADSEPESIDKNDPDFIPDIPQKIPVNFGSPKSPPSKMRKRKDQPPEIFPARSSAQSSAQDDTDDSEC